MPTSVAWGESSSHLSTNGEQVGHYHPKFKLRRGRRRRGYSISDELLRGFNVLGLAEGIISFPQADSVLRKQCGEMQLREDWRLFQERRQARLHERKWVMPTQEMITCPMLTFPRNLHWRLWPNSPATPPPSLAPSRQASEKKKFRLLTI
jgi:hypothetical protein